MASRRSCGWILEKEGRFLMRGAYEVVLEPGERAGTGWVWTGRGRVSLAMWTPERQHPQKTLTVGSSLNCLRASERNHGRFFLSLPMRKSRDNNNRPVGSRKRADCTINACSCFKCFLFWGENPQSPNQRQWQVLRVPSQIKVIMRMQHIIPLAE